MSRQGNQFGGDPQPVDRQRGQGNKFGQPSDETPANEERGFVPDPASPVADQDLFDQGRFFPNADSDLAQQEPFDQGRFFPDPVSPSGQSGVVDVPVTDAEITVEDELGNDARTTGLIFAENTGFRIRLNDEGLVVIEVPPPSTPFRISGSLSAQDSSVFVAPPASITLTVSTTSGTFTEIVSFSPSGGMISDMTVVWSDTTPFVGEGAYNFSANATGVNSEGETQGGNVSGSFTRFVPEFVMAAQPTTFADFSGERRSSRSVTSVASPTYLATTTDYGAAATGDVMGFPVTCPRVGSAIDSDPDEAGIVHSYNIYRIPVAAGSQISSLR